MFYVKMFVLMLFGSICYAVSTTLDLIAITFVFITKGVRWLYLKFGELITDVDYSDVWACNNLAVNTFYTCVINFAYPDVIEEDEES